MINASRQSNHKIAANLFGNPGSVMFMQLRDCIKLKRGGFVRTTFLNSEP